MFYFLYLKLETCMPSHAINQLSTLFGINLHHPSFLADMILELFAICCCIYLWYRQFKRNRKSSLTAVYDLDNLGNSKSDDERVKGNAVICGGRCVLQHMYLL
jgi:hypothetical protein